MTARPFLLRPDNFTPPQRTPWGGRRIPTRFKADLDLGRHVPGSVVGESWELSATPELPSETADGRQLGDVLASDRRAMLGAEAAIGRDRTALLVKWLDADDDLSLQIHPDDDYAGLDADESGKPECWYVVAAAPGAGLYLGFAAGTDEARVRQLLDAGADLSAIMAFREVQVGDVVRVDPGMPHAIGRGLTLIEPQVVLPGRRGVTYRYWDWNRRYDERGRRDAAGQPRRLDLEHALAVTDWRRATDAAALMACRAAHGAPDTTAAASAEPLCGPDAQLPSDRLQLTRLAGRGEQALPGWDVLRALTVIEGELTLHGEGARLTVPSGQTAAIPASCRWRATLRGCHALVSAVVA